jgi:hypothetical protein
MLALSDARDRPVIEQDGYYIAPGNLNVIFLGSGFNTII